MDKKRDEPGGRGAIIRPTMMDVASAAGVSQATVSLVLNDTPGVRLSDSTRERVWRAADDLGYKLIRRGQHRAPLDQTMIAFVADEVATDPWMALAFDGVRDKALEYGLTACLAVTRGDLEAEETILKQMGPQLLGIIYGTILTRRIEPSKALLDSRTVLVNCYDAKRRLPSVLPGELVGGRVATERLLQAGRKRIGLINGQEGLDASRDRLKGYRQALSSHDISFDPDLVKPGNWEPSSGYEMTQALMALGNPPDAIFCANDMMAVGCLDALRELGLKVPDDISLIGFDDREIAQFTRPPLTTLILPHYEMGEIAAEMLINAAGGLQAGPTQIKVECTLVERESV